MDKQNVSSSVRRANSCLVLLAPSVQVPGGYVGIPDALSQPLSHSANRTPFARAPLQSCFEVIDGQEAAHWSGSPTTALHLQWPEMSHLHIAQFAATLQRCYAAGSLVVMSFTKRRIHGLLRGSG